MRWFKIRVERKSACSAKWCGWGKFLRFFSYQFWVDGERELCSCRLKRDGSTKKKSERKKRMDRSFMAARPNPFCCFFFFFFNDTFARRLLTTTIFSLSPPLCRCCLVSSSLLFLLFFLIIIIIIIISYYYGAPEMISFLFLIISFFILNWILTNFMHE